jgi:cell division protein FtsZ
MSKSERIIQLGVNVTEGLGAGSQPEVGRAAAEECIDEIIDHLSGTHMCFVTAGMGGGTGTGAAPVVARAAREKGILTVGVVTKPFHFEGQRRMQTADQGIEDLQKNVDTLIVIPNQNLFRIANDKTTFADAFAMADQVLYSGVACITDLMVKEGLINLDFADVRSVMREMGKAMMGTGEASGEGRAMAAAEAAIANPLLDESSMRGAQGLLISITGGRDLTLFEVDEAATRIREEVDPEANIILGATFDEDLEGVIRVSVVATGIDRTAESYSPMTETPRSIVRPVHRPVAQSAQPVVRQAAQVQTAAAVAQTKLQEDDFDDIEAIIAETDAQAVPAAARSGEEFKPQSRIFKGEAAPTAAVRPAAPAAPQAAAAQVKVSTAAAEKPAEAASRMPKVEDFPPVVKAEIEQRATQQPEERGPLGLLKRLTSSLNHRREPDYGQLEAARQREPQLRPAADRGRPAAEAPQPANPRAAHLDDHGRAAPQLKTNHEDDQLEIPAFLRRQISG